MIVVEDVRLTNFDEETTDIFKTEFLRNVKTGILKLFEEKQESPKEESDGPEPTDAIETQAT